ncbi:MAG: response regulator [Alphaproteobacteria bacterium]|nr:response regulator [Alphaproteobacteria bacterium]
MNPILTAFTTTGSVRRIPNGDSPNFRHLKSEPKFRLADNDGARATAQHSYLALRNGPRRGRRGWVCAMTDKRLLMVDDEPALGEIVRFVAEDLGYDVQITTHGKEFMQAFESFEPTTIIVDIVMPNIDGIELIHWLHGHDCDAKILVTSGSSEAYARMARNLGDARGLDISVIEKPFRTATLRALLA